MDVQNWVKRCLVSFTKYDESSIENLLFRQKINNIPKPEQSREIIQEILSKEFKIEEGNPEVWVTFLSEHIIVMNRKHQPFRHINFAFQSLVTIFKEDDEGYRLIETVKKYSRKLIKEGTKSSNLDEVFNSFRKLLSACQRNKPLPDSHVIGLLFAVNISIKNCFRLNNLQQVTSLFRIMNNPNSRLPKIQVYPKAEQVEHKFYEGKYYLLENRVEDAIDSFEYAFRVCRNVHFKNEKLILRYLIPANAIYGKYASRDLLEKYQLEEYKDLLIAVREGNVLKVDEILENNQDSYLKYGIVLSMSTLRLVAIKNFCNKIKIIQKDTKISFDVFEKAFGIIGVELESQSRLVSIFNSLLSKELLKVKLDLMNGFVIFS